MTDEFELLPQTAFPVVRIKGGVEEEKETLVATEVPLTIVVNEVEVATLLCTPANLKELVVGFLFSSGLVTSASSIQRVAVDRQVWRADVASKTNIDRELMEKRLYTSGCGKGVIFSNVIELSYRTPLSPGPKIDKDEITSAMAWLQKCSPLHQETGGIHSASIFVPKTTPAFFMDDIGRHNAVDKAIGEGLRRNMDLENVAAIFTGRSSSEIIFKAKQARIPILISRSAPTHHSVMLARKMNITLIGFARSNGFTIFSGRERIERF